jgi:hypothetical protein
MNPPQATRVLCLGLGVFFSFETGLFGQIQRVNLAKYQNCAASSTASGEPASFATDGIVGNGNRWKSDPAVAGPHWLSITLPLAMQVGSAHLYLGRDDIEPVANFSLQYRTGGAWVNIPGATFSATTATVFNVVFPSPVTAAEFRFYTTEAAARVREIALFPTNGPAGYPLGTDVTLNLAKKRLAVGSSVDGTSYGKGAVDGYVENDLGRWKSANVNGPHTLEVDLQESTRLGSAHLYLGSTGNPTVTNFTLEYWTGSAWAVIPGGTVAGNTNRELRLDFTSIVTASRVRVNIPGNGSQRIREWLVFAAAAGIPGYPLGTDVVFAAPPTTKFDTYGDGFWKIVNRAFPNSLIAGPTGASQTQPDSTEEEKHFQLLYNLDSDTFRLRNRDSWKCIEALNASRAPGAAVVEGNDYQAMPHELWRFQDLGGGYWRVVNVWNGLALQTDGGSPANVTLALPSSDPRQQWQLNYQTHYPKKGSGGYDGDWAKFGVSWNYNWGRDTGANLPAHVVFTPMQHNRWWPDWNTLPQSYSPWHTTSKPVALLGYNEPEEPSQGNISMADAIALWPLLEQTDIPLVSPVPVNPFNGWLNDFYSQAGARGYRIDFTAVHWYANPDAGGLINLLQSVYNTWGRPVWLTEFSTVDWGGTATWTEENNYRFLSEFMWRAEDLIWLKRYAIFSFSGDPPANPWDRVGARGNMFRNDGSTFTAFGELYAAWDGDRTRRERTPYFIQGLGSMHRLRTSSTNDTPSTGNIRRNDVSAQWALVPNAAATRHYIVSLRDGRRLRFDGTTLDLALPGTTGAFAEWTFNGPDGNGYTFVDHPATSKSLRLGRINDGNGAPTSLTYGMENFGTVQDATRWRFIKPYQPASVAPPPAVVNVRATGGFGQVTLSWSPSTATNILHYSVHRRISSNGPYAPVAAGLKTPGWIDSNVYQGTTYRYVVTATDWIENESAQSVEASATPIGPRLTVSQSMESLSLSWPTGIQTYRLMSATNLTPPIDWVPEPGAILSNGLWTFTIPSGTNGDHFFRLQWP